MKIETNHTIIFKNFCNYHSYTLDKNDEIEKKKCSIL